MQTSMLSKPSRMSSLVSARPLMPQVRTVWRTSMASNQPQRRLRRHRVGRGDVRISAVVDVEQRALRALEQYALALAALLVEQPPHGLGVRQKFWRQRGQLFQDTRAVDLRQTKPP